MLPINRNITIANKTVMSNKQNKYIVVHYVGAVSNAKNNTIYYKDTNRKASAHYFVDESSIWQCVEDKDMAWHCGGAVESEHHPYLNICTNSNSIGVEMCCKKTAAGDWYFEKETVKNTADLVRYLMKKYDIPIDRVIRHYDVTGKKCPAPYVSEKSWSVFKEKVEMPFYELTTINDIVWELAHRGIITDGELWLYKLRDDVNAYWLARKCLKAIMEKETE